MRTMVAMESGGRQLDYPAGTTQQRQSRSLRMLIFDPCSDRGGGAQASDDQPWKTADSGALRPLGSPGRHLGTSVYRARPCTGICSDPASFSAVNYNLDRQSTYPLLLYTTTPQLTSVANVFPAAAQIIPSTARRPRSTVHRDPRTTSLSHSFSN